MTKETAVLKSQNMEFEDRILIISHQLKQSNALVDKLSADLKGKPNSVTAIDNARKELSTTKLSYENQIAELKRTIENFSSCVTREEYARVKNESDRNASILATKLDEINSLRVKVKDLEDRLKRSDESILNLKSIHKPTTEVNAQQLAAPSTEPFKQQLSPTFLKSKTRREIITAAGGLNRLRSPLTSIQDNGRTLAIRLASTHGKENISCQ